MRIGSEFRLLAPWAVMAFGAMAVFVLSLVIWSHQVDAGARAREENLVLQGVLARVTEVEQALVTQISSEAAAAHLADRFDPDWARSDLPVRLAAAAEFDDVAVLNDRDDEVYPKPGDIVSRLGARPLVSEVRQAEVRAGLAAGHAVPVQRSAFTAAGGTVRLVTATLVRSRTAVPGRRGVVVLTSQDVTAGFLALIRDRFQVEPISAALGARAAPGLASIAFDTAPGQPDLVLSWAPQHPGADLLQRAGLPVLAVVLVFGGIGLVMMWHMRRATHELLASNRAQSEFLANMSHEIRTPLNGVVAIAGALTRTPLSPHQSELVQIIRTSGVTLERLLSDVLDLARIETGAVAIEPEPFHLGEAVRSAMALHSSRADEKGVSLTLVLDPAADVTVVGDQIRLKQILTNLLSNAIKFTEQGGVTVQVAPLGVQDRWRFTVEDTGIGFEPAMRDKIFGRFQQADGSVTRRFGGTGLGLAICKQLSELMGGGIEAIGRPGAGARFTVILPMPLGEAEPAAGPAPDCPARPLAQLEPDVAERPLRVLVADDHATNRRVIEVLLAGLDVELVSTANGLEACEAFEAGAFDAVLMDMQMPVMDGLSATRRIRSFEARERLAPAFVAMLTANAQRDHQDASLAAGADIRLPKPIEAARLFAALDQAARKAAARAEAA